MAWTRRHHRSHLDMRYDIGNIARYKPSKTRSYQACRKHAPCAGRRKHTCGARRTAHVVLISGVLACRAPQMQNRHLFLQYISTYTNLAVRSRARLDKPQPPLDNTPPLDADAHISATVRRIASKFEPIVRQRPSLNRLCHWRRSPFIATVVFCRKLQ